MPGNAPALARRARPRPRRGRARRRRRGRRDPRRGRRGVPGRCVPAVLDPLDPEPARALPLDELLAVTTAALVCAGEADPRGPVARPLSLRPVGWVGQISYGLYLWHWLVILAITSIEGPLRLLPGATGLNLVRVLVTLGLTVTSFYLLEQAIRRGRMPVLERPERRFVAATAAGIAVVSSTVLSSTSAATPNLVAKEIPNCPQFSIRLRHQGPRAPRFSRSSATRSPGHSTQPSSPPSTTGPTSWRPPTHAG